MDIENIAITGIAGRFPNAENAEDLKEALIKGTDLIADSHKRWPCESMGTPQSMGIVTDFDKFDASFFEINPKSTELHDPRGRKLLEVVYESIVDAGINPCNLKGSNTGVFVALMQNTLNYDYLKLGSGINSSSYIIANNISYTFDFRGPSCAIDTGCSSSIYAINQAIDNIRLGACEAAVVCSAHANFSPYDSVEFSKLGVLNPDGRCKSFDDDRNGYVKSEAVVAIFLQKKQGAKRIYATISGIGCSTDGYKEDGLIHPSSERQISLFRSIYQRYKINPNNVVYIDCHGTGTLVGDIEECRALAEFFANTERHTPLQIGSVKTNLGHTEAAGGLVSLVKILIAIQTEIIPANLHFKTPAMDIPALTNGMLKVVSSNIEYKGGLMALNSFGLGGANGHLVIKPYAKCKFPKNENKQFRLVQVSGRSEEAVEKLLDKIEMNRDETGFLALIDNIFSTKIKNHNYRGYTILNSSTRFVSKCCLKKRPVWFTYSGMGSQWPHMGRDLMNFEVFRNTFKKCAEVVKEYDLDLEDIILNGTATVFDDPINCFTSIVAVSVALTDLLFSFGIYPDGIIGHSLGEIGCAYGDGLITAEQATLIGYGRGWATKNTGLIPGLMASVGLSVKECEKLLPENIFIACDNSENNVTISGPEISVKLFVEDLRKQGIFVKIVNTANIAFHSKYVERVGKHFYNFITKILPEPRKRKLWLPSSVPSSHWDSDLAKYNSAEYQVHNFLNKVLYNQVLKRVPTDAILVEIAPCGLFQAIFRRTLSPNITRLYLVKKFHTNNEEFLLDSVGKFYLAGGQSILKKIYHSPEYPVGPETPMLSPLVKWNHDYAWPIPKYIPNKYFGKKVEIDTTSKENKFLLGHVINGRNIFPATGYIVSVWQTFAKMLGMYYEHMPVVIEKIKFLKFPVLSTTNSIILNINILKSGTFEISDEEEELLATGRIFGPSNVENLIFRSATSTMRKIQPDIKLNSSDVYKILKFRGYDYENSFRGIMEIDCNEKSAKVKWSKNWITLLDPIFQAAALMENSTLVVPTEVSKIVINPVITTQHLNDRKEMVLNYNYLMKTSSCVGLEIKNISWSRDLYKKENDLSQKLKCEFIPNICTHLSESIEFEKVLQIALQIVIENKGVLPSLAIAEILNKNLDETCKSSINNIMHPKYLVNFDHKVISNVTYLNDAKYDVIIVRDLENNEEVLNYFASIDEGTFIFIQISNNDLEILLKKSDFITVFKRMTAKKSLVLCKKPNREEITYAIINIETDYSDIKENIKTAIRENTRILLVSHHYNSRIFDIQRCIGNEYLSKIRIFCIKDKDAGIFNTHSTFYQEQIRKDITVNILKNNEWGTYRHLPIEETNMLIHVDSCFLTRINNKFQWVQQNPYVSVKSRVNVCYSSIGFFDQYMINKQTDKKVRLGMEYSGINAGTRVMGISPGGSLTTHLVPNRNLSWIVPREWNLKEAATVPFAYTMSYYGLVVKGNLQSQDTVLINYNAHSIEFAAINFTLSTHCTLLVGVNSQKHIRYLVSYFPKLKYNIIDFSKKDATERVLHRTSGQGIDIIFNSGKEDILKYGLEMLRNGGKLINIDLNGSLHSNIVDELGKDCIIYNISLDTLLKENDYILEDVRNSIREYLCIGIIKPFPSKVIDMAEINSFLENFKYDSNQNEKITVKIHRVKEASLGKNKKHFIANSRTYFCPDKCYVVMSDLKDFDLEVMKWLSKRGAKKFIISSVRRATTGYQVICLENLKKHGNTIITNCFDTTCTKGAEELLIQATSVGSVGGIFCFCMEQAHNPKESFSDGEYLTEYQNKFKSIKNIDVLSRKLFRNLDHFVVFLSQSFELEYSAQTHYGYINTSIQNLCDIRREANLPALAVEWGPVASVDCLSHLRSRSINILPQSIPSCLETLDFFMQLNHTMVYSTVLNSNEKSGGEKDKLSIIESVAKIFGIKNIDQIDFSTPLINLGMDSIMGFEMKNLLYSNFNVDFALNEIRRLTLESIKKLAEKSC